MVSQLNINSIIKLYLIHTEKQNRIFKDTFKNSYKICSWTWRDCFYPYNSINNSIWWKYERKIVKIIVWLEKTDCLMTALKLPLARPQSFVTFLFYWIRSNVSLPLPVSFFRFSLCRRRRVWPWWPAAFKAAAFLGRAAVSNCGRSLGFVSSEGHRARENGREIDVDVGVCVCV